MASKTTYYRRLRRAKELGCSVDELPDNRGKHSNHSKGSQHHRWNDSRLKRSDGYTLIRVGVGHPLADPNGYAPEHLLVWVSAGNQKPCDFELIHHKNEDKQDNRIENLECVTKIKHNEIHNVGKGRSDNGQFVGKKSAGRLLDGREWNEYPKS